MGGRARRRAAAVVAGASTFLWGLSVLASAQEPERAGAQGQVAAAGLAPVSGAATSRAPVSDAPVTDTTVVELALAHNPALAAATADLQRAELLERAEEHRYGFVLGADLTATRTSSPTLGPYGVTVPASTLYKGGAELKRHLVWGTDLSLRLEVQSQVLQTAFFNPTVNPPALSLIEVGPGYGGLVKFGVTHPFLRGAGRDIYAAELAAARASRNGARSERDQTASQLLLDVLTAYWELEYASRAVEIQRRSLELARAQRDDTEARVRTGGMAPVDLLSFETRIATIEEDLASARAEELRRANELARLTGEHAVARRRPAIDSALPVPSPWPAEARERVLSTSFELAQQRAQVELAEVQAKTASDALRPRLDATGYVQAQGLGNREVAPALEQLGRLGAVSAQIGLIYEAPLDDTRYRAERERADLAIRAGRDRLESIRQRLLAEYDNANIRDEAARRRIELAERTRQIAVQQQQAEVARFKTGTATALQVREAEDQVRSAELRAARARADLVESSLTMEHLTGRLLERWSRRVPPVQRR